MFSPSTRATLRAYALLMPVSAVLGYSNNHCPQRCAVAGPDPGNWTSYHNLEQFDSCPLAVLQAFSIYADVDDASHPHGIYACGSYGSDFENMPSAPSGQVRAKAAGSVDATFEVGWWDDGRSFAAADIRSASRQLRKYLGGGHGGGPSSNAAILYARSGAAAVGLYIGQGLQWEGVSSVALKMLEDNISALNASPRAVAMQFCQPGLTSEHIFGLFATTNKTFAPVQKAMRSWSNATCLSFNNSRNFTGQAVLASPIVSVITTSGSNSAAIPSKSTTLAATRRLTKRVVPHARATCSTVQVQAGDSCGSLASKCGISGSDFTNYNSGSGFCSLLKPGLHVCCSAGVLPDFRPKANADGTCFVYYVARDDNCANIAAANSLTTDDLEKFNKQTWAWSGCKLLQFNMNICLSDGAPPMPAPLSGTHCGPQMLGTKRPTDRNANLADLNPCALNACCNIWGQCGTTPEFCTESGTGNPGTARPGTNGCISNCGMNIVRGDPPASPRRIAYFEGFNLKRECLLQDALQIDTAGYTHLHFAFGVLTADYKVQFGDVLTSYEFEQFKRIRGPARILSFGGWDFSTKPDTYMIFREGVTPANRLKMAQNIANFVKDNGLDGVDIDWEYPGAPDIPGIPGASADDGDNYLAFLVILKNLLPGKSVSIAAPSSYWYLRAFPIATIARIVDYIVYMTYDLHGQWDAESAFSQDGCAYGSCLRSQVNLTETMNSLIMITKAGVPSNKVVVGVTSYGRSFKMAQSGCYGPDCLFTGPRYGSEAKKGRCTDTAGYISGAEIKEIAAQGERVVTHYYDAQSDSNILVYDDTQWVGYMDDNAKSHRELLYSRLNMGGTTSWATDLEAFHPVPRPSESWLNFQLDIKAGKNPSVDNRSGDWTQETCDGDAAQNIRDLTPSQRWDQLHCASAWKYAIDVWKNTDRPTHTLIFTASVSKSLNGPPHSFCGSLTENNNCGQTLPCESFGHQGASSAEIWNSLVLIHEVYSSYHNALFKVAGAAISPSLADFQNKFAPVPVQKGSAWTLLLELVSMGAPVVLSRMLRPLITRLPALLNGEQSDKVANGLGELLVGQSVTIAKNLITTNGNNWTAENQAELSNYLGQAIMAWGNVTSLTLGELFNGKDENIDNLYAIISDGKFMEGAGRTISSELLGISEPDLEAAIAKTFFSYAIPTAWTFSKHHPFIIDSGYHCGDAVEVLLSLHDPYTMNRTSACHNGKLYYLAGAEGKSEVCTCLQEKGCVRVCTKARFPSPPGLAALDGKSFGGVTVQDIIIG